MVVRTWGNRLTGAIAAALFSLVPVSYGIIGNANLTNAFGQAVSIVTIAVLDDPGRAPAPPGGASPAVVAVLATLGLLCHISTLVLLPSTLTVVAVLFWRFGGQPLRARPARSSSWSRWRSSPSTAIYWGHFGDVYRVQFERLRAAVVRRSTAPETAPRGGVPAATRRKPRIGTADARFPWTGGRGRPSIRRPAASGGRSSCWRSSGRGAPSLKADAAASTSSIAAWTIVWFVFVTASVLSPGNKSYQQDAYEFIGRVVHATLPAAVLLAARGAAWGWRAGTSFRLASVALLGWAVFTGIRAWGGWIGLSP